MKKSKLQSLIEEKLKGFKGDKFSSKEIAQEIMQEHPESELGVPLQYVASIAYKMYTAEKDPTVPEEKLDFDDSDECKYSVSDGKYTWETKRAGKISIPVSEVDEIFWEYSEYGMDMSQQEVRSKHRLTIPQFNSIKSTLWLYKKSNIYSPHTWDNTSESDRTEMVAAKMKMKTDNQDEIVRSEAYKEKLKTYKKVIKKDAHRQYHQEEFFEELNALLPSVEKITKRVIPPEQCSTDELVISIADTHIGADVDGLRITRKFNRCVLEEYLITVAETANLKCAKEVTLVILGDLIESFSGNNHPDSWKNMDKNLVSAKLVIESYNILGNFFGKINNLKNIKIVGGNHDRAAANKKEDNEPTIAAIISYMLQEKFSGEYNIEFDNLVLDHSLGDNIKIIISHGDNSILKKTGEMSLLDAKVMEFGDPDKFNLILTGHWHSRKINEDRSYARWYTTPSIFSGNNYSERNGWNAEPGFFLITEDKKSKRPVVIDCPL